MKPLILIRFAQQFYCHIAAQASGMSCSKYRASSREGRGDRRYSAAKNIAAKFALEMRSLPDLIPNS